MPLNKTHKVIEDCYSFDYMDDKQLTRVGLTLREMALSKTIVVSQEDLVKLNELVKVETDRDLSKFKDKKYCIQFSDKYDILMTIALDGDAIIAIPFSDNTTTLKYEPYDLYIRLENFNKADFTMEVHAINPLAEGEDINPIAWNHAVTLSAFLTVVLTALQDDRFYLEESTEDLSKINKKRLKNNKVSLITHDYKLKVSE